MVTLSPAGTAPPGRGRELVLCLSGGGFRATYFHLGVLRYLSEIDELRHVTDIFAVSGGSILAAHLAQRWNEYKVSQTFNDAAQELRALAERDVRGRIVRTWLLASTLLAIPLYYRRFRRNQLLIQEYERFFSQGGRSTALDVLSPWGRKKNSVPDGPRVHLLTTSLTTGLLCAFTGGGFVRFDDSQQPSPVFQSSKFNLPLAVAASSAFPPLFPPISVNAKVFGIPRQGFGVDIDYLSDGGVYDNLGISAVMKGFWNAGLSSLGMDILISDASASFDWKTRSRFWNIVDRTARSSDVLMKRVAELEIQREWIGFHAALQAVTERRHALERDQQRPNSGDDQSHAELQRDEFKTELEHLRNYPGCELVTVCLDGMRVDAFVLPKPHYSAFDARWHFVPPNPYSRRVAEPWEPPSAPPWARLVASIRTDLDRFSSVERQYLEVCGYNEASKKWHPRDGFPGWMADKIGGEPTQKEVQELQKSERRKYRLIELRHPAGIALCIIWIVLLILVGIIGWHLARG